MKLYRLPSLIFCLIIFALMPLLRVDAQDDGKQAVLDTIISAYATTSSSSSYAIEWRDQTDQDITLTRSDLTLLFEFALDVDQEGSVQNGNIMGTFEYSVDQSQTVNDGEDSTGTVELTVNSVLINSDLYVNFDDTKEEFRTGLPTGWQLVNDDFAFSEEIILSKDELTTYVNQLILNGDTLTNLLTTDIVTAIEDLGEDDKDDVLSQGYMLTLDLNAAIQAQDNTLGDSLGGLGLSTEALQVLIENAEYTIEIWIGKDDSMIREQEIVIELENSLEAGMLEGDLADVSVGIEYSKKQTLELSGFGQDYSIEAPTLAE